MIVHSTYNELDDGCMVQVEGIPHGMSDVIVRLFAQGAAAKHNSGYTVDSSIIARWLDDNGRPIPEGSDTTAATGARVLCKVDQP